MPIVFFDQKGKHIPNSSDWAATLKIFLLFKTRYQWEKFDISMPVGTTLAACHQFLENTPDRADQLQAGYFWQIVAGPWNLYADYRRFAGKGIGEQMVMEGTELDNRVWAHEKTEQIAAQERENRMR